ncbi:aminodeoxychorismate lyase [Marinobacter fonticola]|uniref:aminodeoxychorismate lyase n=1 Tax=Marinobacter fonticola TaxID=2603215 RepID=UPI00143DDA66|nr:aminodeoxychorismate lyase [Marinobacter fonticola]
MAACIWAEEQSIPADDRGLAYGDGLFETIRIRNHRPTLVDFHLQRLLTSAERLGIPLGADTLAHVLHEATERYGDCGDWVLKLILTRGTGGRGYRPDANCKPRLIASHHRLPPQPRGAVGVTICPHPLVVDPLVAGMKTLNRLPQVLASQAMPDWAYESLMTDSSGGLLEGTRTNVFARVAGVWVTPPASVLAVAGVARQAIIDYLDGQEETVDYRPITQVDLQHWDFDGLLLTNSVVGAIAIEQINDTRLPMGPSLAKIRSFLAEAVGS